MLKTLRNNGNKQMIIKYLIITFLYTWCVWGIIVASSKGIIFPDISLKYTFEFIILGGLSPSVLAFIFEGITEGKKGIIRLLKKILIWRVNPLWYVFSLGYIPFIYYLPAFLCKIFGEQYIIRPRFQFINLFILFIGQMFAGPINEEFGWRGFVLPRLQQKMSPIMASITVGIIHATWHIPLYFISGQYQFKSNFIIYLLIVVCYSFIYTWLYNGTGGSILFVCLLHASFNFQPNYFYVATPSNPSVLFSILSNSFAYIPLLLIIGVIARKKYSKVII